MNHTTIVFTVLLTDIAVGLLIAATAWAVEVWTK